MKKIFFAGLAGILMLGACDKEQGKSFPSEPQIYDQTTTPREVNLADSLFSGLTIIKFKFTDGDGDIGVQPSDTVYSIFIRDSRDTSSSEYSYAFPFPFIPQNIRPDGGLEGQVTLNIGRQYYRSWDSFHLAEGKDTLTWSIYIKDLGGHKSNVITSDTIFVRYF